QNKTLIVEFTKRYGIQAQYLRISTADLTARYGAEVQAGTAVADFVLGADVGVTSPSSGITNFFDTFEKNGWTVPLARAKIPGFPWTFPKEFLRGNRAIVSFAPWVIGYNTQIVKDAPKQWTDILDKRFSGQIIAVDPNISDVYIQLWATIQAKYGDKFF